MVKVTIERNIMMVSCLYPREQFPHERLQELNYKAFGGAYRDRLSLYLRHLAESTENDEIVVGCLAEMRGGSKPYTAFPTQTRALEPDFGIYSPNREVFVVPGHTSRCDSHPITIHLIGDPSDLSDGIADFINSGFLWEDFESQQEAIRVIEFLDRLKESPVTPPQPASSA